MLVTSSSTRAGAIGPWRCVILLCGVALGLAGLSASAAPLKPEPAPMAAEPSLLPAPLSAADADLYRRMLALQAEGKAAAADKLAASLTDKRLLGHVLA